MDFICDCSLKNKTIGDGCRLCNTEYMIDHLLTPAELAEELGAVFAEDQAEFIAAEIYQPLIGVIKTLNQKINQLAGSI